MADMFLDPIMEEIINAGFRYLKDQVRWQTGMKEELVKLQENLPQIQAVVHFASSQEQITEQNPHLNKWLWQLRDAIDDAYDVVDELEYIELEEQATKNKKLRKVRSIMKSMKKKLVKIGKRALKIDPTLKRLEEAVQKLHRVSTTGVDTFLHLVKDAKKELQKQQLELHGARETGSLPKNDFIGRGKEKELVTEWLIRNPSNEPRGTDLYRNISLLSIVGHGGMGKTSLLQHVYKDDEITKEFYLKMWVCVSNNFDVKKVMADMLESLKKERPRLETLGELQRRVEEEVMSK
ncbi:Putative disease resistance protein RGA1 [Dendrobium catenatum]|uniref:Disease resistance protein RGA1 n=2 Tax=Dendrobium catenatum TaxID=906689 RepID=A0A2I0XI86_9ASPA|nr:Putative disease resistance protein RGA1 [Dendrobium catenatum]